MSTFPMHSDRQSDSPNSSAPLQVPKLWKWWFTLTGPQINAFSTDINTQERQRRAMLISALLLLPLFAIGLLLPSTVFSASSTFIKITIIILATGCLVVALLNRGGYTNLSAIFYVALVDGAIASYLFLKPSLNSGNLSDFDLFILAVLAGGMILPRFLVPITGLVHIGLIMSIFFLRPHDALLSQLIQEEGGNPYVALAGLLILQVSGTGIAWLHSWSVRQGLLRASRAEELAAARAALSEQAQQIVARNHRLEEGITQILETHRQIAAGNLVARAPVQEEHELWQIGHSLNTLIMRFQQQGQEDQELRQALQEINQVIVAMLAKRAGKPTPVPPCRTPLGQRLLLALAG